MFPTIKQGAPNTAMSEVGPKLGSKGPNCYYSLQFIRNKLGTISTRIIKEQGKKNNNKKKWKSIANQSEKGVTENNSTTDTPK